MDPFQSDVGYDLGRPKADIVTISHSHSGHNNAEAIKGEPRIIRGPGEYEARGIFITGIPAYHDAQRGQERGKNTIYLFELEDFVLCHLGDLGHLLAEDQVAAMSGVDVLLVPVGGGSTIDAAQAVEVISQIEPRLVVPMHFRTPSSKRPGESVDRFCREMGLTEWRGAEKLMIKASDLPEGTQVVVLEPRG